MLTKTEVLFFIKNFSKSSEDPKVMVNLFFNDYSYYFAKILEERFKKEADVIVMFNPIDDHFACLIDDILYDVVGEIEMSDDWYTWEGYQASQPLDTERVKRYYIDKSVEN